MNQTIKTVLLIAFLGFMSIPSLGQDSLEVKTPSLKSQLDSIGTDSTLVLSPDSISKQKKATTKDLSMGLSAIYPGWGQLKNKQYYKVPVFAGLYTAGLVYSIKQRVDYAKFNNAYQDRFLPDAILSYPNLTDAELFYESLKKKRKFNTALAGTIVVYSFNLLDAYTSALRQDKKRPHSPIVAAYRSAVLPGWGQHYNGKKWKIPIVYAGFGVGAFFLIDTYRKLDGFTRSYIFIDDPDFVVPDLVNKLTVNSSSASELLLRRDQYRTRFEITIFLTTAWYLLNIIDATVDGHLYEFDEEMSDDLSLRIAPFIGPDGNGNTAAGLSLNLKF